MIIYNPTEKHNYRNKRAKKPKKPTLMQRIKKAIICV